MAFDTFLKLDGIDGESTDDKHKGEIELQSFSWGAHNPVTIGSGTGGIGGGKVSLSSFSVMKKTDKASPKLFLACCSGEHIKTAKVTVRKAGKEQLEYLTYEFTELMVESVHWSGAAGGDESPAESLSFAYAKVVIKYSPQNKEGKLESPIPGGWDQTKNVKA